MSKEIPKVMRLALLMDDLMVMQMVLMMEMNSAHLTVKLWEYLMEVLANIVFFLHRHSDTSNILQYDFIDGKLLGSIVGNEVDGDADGNALGLSVGCLDGDAEGDIEGDELGLLVGCEDGGRDGTGVEGCADGDWLGDELGVAEGEPDGDVEDGVVDGGEVGASDGSSVGALVGNTGKHCLRASPSFVNQQQAAMLQLSMYFSSAKQSVVYISQLQLSSLFFPSTMQAENRQYISVAELN
eukprot:scaffold598_cov168-Skeletonema_menzelii.AAC.1